MICKKYKHTDTRDESIFVQNMQQTYSKIQQNIIIIITIMWYVNLDHICAFASLDTKYGWNGDNQIITTKNI